MAENQIIIKKAEPVSLNSGIELPIDGLPVSIQRYIGKPKPECPQRPRLI